MGKDFAKEYRAIAHSFSSIIEDISLLSDDCDKLADESSFGSCAALRLKALGMPLAETLAALVDAAYMEENGYACNGGESDDDEPAANVEEPDVDPSDRVEYDTLNDFLKEYADKPYRVVTSYFDGPYLNITIRIPGESENRYLVILNHSFVDPEEWYAVGNVNTSGYHAVNVADALTSALTSGDLGYIGGPCDGVD